MVAHTHKQANTLDRGANNLCINDTYRGKHIYLRLPTRCDKCVYLSLPNAIFTMQRHRFLGHLLGRTRRMWNAQYMAAVDWGRHLLTRRLSATPPCQLSMCAIKANSQGRLISSGS